ncbi:MAG: YiiX/YebB-like N1pC/P60 family cysteine hydrolase [Crocinitomicaceae bacterium]
MKPFFAILFIVPLIFTSCNGDGNSDDAETTVYVHTPPSLPEEIYEKLAPGDIIIRKGNGPLSYHLMNNTKEDYSHCGIIVKEGEEWKVIHTIGGSASEESIDGMQTIDLDEFVAHAADSNLFICRPIFVDSAGPKVAAGAYEYLEAGAPFDHSFSLYTPEKLYCSELLYYIFKDVAGKNIFEVIKKHKSYILMFGTFFDEEKFEPVFHLKPNKKDWYILHED